ncbi:hypothetical protein BGZ67_003453 [Mortierella alpina]|nr:hypothetical protein BGZ67_003453 [Mortierella alpina]
MEPNIHVIIVGAGIGGLMLATLLEKAGTSYQVLEKSEELKPLGCAVTLSSVGHLFEQLGLRDDLNELSKPFGALHLCKEDMSLVGSFYTRKPGHDVEENYGDYARAVSRPDLVRLLMKQVNPNRVHFSKRVVSTTQDRDRVSVTCRDGTVYSGSILVGADGVYSKVRENMYEELQMANALPWVDSLPLRYGYECAVGVAENLDPELYPVVEEKYCEFVACLGKKIPYSWWLIPLTNNRVGWMIVHDIRDQNLTAADKPEWSPVDAIKMCNSTRHFTCPYGGTMGDIIDATPQVSKIMLEDKMVPFGGMGANMAIQSALKLANVIYDIESDSQQDIKRAFDEYFEDRQGDCKGAVNASNYNGAFIHAKGLIANALRYVIKWVPNWLVKIGQDKLNSKRQQASFLPFVKMRGKFQNTAPAVPSLRRPIFEKSKDVNNLSIAVSLGPLMQIFEQLGMYEEILSLSKPAAEVGIRGDQLTSRGSYRWLNPGKDIADRYGDHIRAIARSDLLNLLLRQIPTSKVHFNKRVLIVKQEDEKVRMRCQDNSTYSGTMIVGADGSYSSIRQNLYRDLERAGILPKTDACPPAYHYDCLVGITEPLDAVKYPVFKNDFTELQIMAGKNVPYDLWVTPLTDNRIAWMSFYNVQADGSAAERSFRFSEWDSNAALQMCSRVRHLPCVYGGSLGDLIDKTPKNRISKIMVADKYFNTWYHKRVVLLGSACHKILPFGSNGVDMAFLSALELANLLYEMPTSNQNEITLIFEKYFQARHKVAKSSVEVSRRTGIMINRKLWLLSELMRPLVYLAIRSTIKNYEETVATIRPQAIFLPLVELRGSAKNKIMNPPKALSCTSMSSKEE